MKTRLFWWITFWGNSCLFGGAILFHFLEAPVNSSVVSFFDSLGWAVGMVTTVGGGNVAPVTVAGKILAIFMMMGGAVFIWTYMALFVGVLIDPELSSIQRDISEFHHDVKEDELLLSRLKKIVEHLEKEHGV